MIPEQSSFQNLPLNRKKRRRLSGKRFLDECRVCRCGEAPAAKWLFPIRGPQRRVFVCGVEVEAALHSFADTTHELENRSKRYSGEISRPGMPNYLFTYLKRLPGEMHYSVRPEIGSSQEVGR